MFTDGTIKETSQKLDDLFFQKEKKKKNENSKLKSGEKRTNPIVLKKLSAEIELTTEHVNSKTKQLEFWELEFSKPNIYNDQQKVKTLTENIKQIKKEIEDFSDLLDKLENEYLELL